MSAAPSLLVSRSRRQSSLPGIQHRRVVRASRYSVGCRDNTVQDQELPAELARAMGVTPEAAARCLTKLEELHGVCTRDDWAQLELGGETLVTRAGRLPPSGDLARHVII